jgi:RNA polymerase sigma-B factor
MSAAVATPTALAVPMRPRTDDPLQLFTRWQQDGDAGAREALVKRYASLARSLARRYGRSSEPFEDLHQVASLGLLKAIDGYDTSRGNFAAYAVPTILGELRRYFRDSGWALHVPRGAQERSMKVREAQEHLTNELGRAPTVSQLAQFLEFEVEQVLDALQAIQAYGTVSLEAPRPSSDETGLSHEDTLGSEDEGYEFVELETTVRQALRQVPVRERQILHMSFYGELTQGEIAERVGVSQMQVSRILRRTLSQLRDLTAVHAGAS